MKISLMSLVLGIVVIKVKVTLTLAKFNIFTFQITTRWLYIENSVNSRFMGQIVIKYVF